VAIALECRTEGNRARRRSLRMQAMKRLAPSGQLPIEGDAIAASRAIEGH
jgi:hypothetical protein